MRVVNRTVFHLTRRVPFAAVFGWMAVSRHPLLKLFLLVGVILGTIVLAVVAVVSLILDILLLPFRLLL